MWRVLEGLLPLDTAKLPILPVYDSPFKLLYLAPG